MKTPKDINLENVLNKKDIMPLIAELYHNEVKYLTKQLKGISMSSTQIFCLMNIYEYILQNPEEKLCQNDLANILKMSKGTIATTLRKLEDEGYIKREIIPNNRRKYELTLTEKGNKIIPEIFRIDKMWEKNMKCKEIDDEFKEKLKKIVVRSIELNNEELK